MQHNAKMQNQNKGTDKKIANTGMYYIIVRVSRKIIHIRKATKI